MAVEDVKAPPVDESELDTLACMDPAERALLRLACKACRASKRAEAASASAARAKKKASAAATSGEFPFHVSQSRTRSQCLSLSDR